MLCKVCSQHRRSHSTWNDAEDEKHGSMRAWNDSEGEADKVRGEKL